MRSRILSVSLYISGHPLGMHLAGKKVWPMMFTLPVAKSNYSTETAVDVACCDDQCRRNSIVQGQCYSLWLQMIQWRGVFVQLGANDPMARLYSGKDAENAQML